MLPNTYPQIVLLGDSITESSFKKGGYGAFLVDKYCAKADVINRGMAGYNSRQLLYKFETDMHLPPAVEIALFVVNIGTNDSSPDDAGRVGLDEYKQNLTAIISHIRSNHPAAGMLFITPSLYAKQAAFDFHQAMGIDNQPPGWSKENMKRYAQACEAVAIAEGLPVVNAYGLHQQLVDSGVDAAYLLPDGIHFSSAGYAPINEKLLETVQSAFPHLDPSVLDGPYDWYFSYALGTKGGNNLEEVKRAREEYRRLASPGTGRGLDEIMKTMYKRKMQRLWQLED